MTSAENSARSALGLSLLTMLMTWLLFLASLYLENVDKVGQTFEEIYESTSANSVSWATYVMWFSVAVFAAGQLVAKKYYHRMFLSGSVKKTPLISHIGLFIHVMIILALVMSFIGVTGIFITNFTGPRGDAHFTGNLLNGYLPILLYTALLLITILFAYVSGLKPAFLPTQEKSSSIPDGPETATDTGDLVERQGSLPQSNRLFTGLAYSFPIIAVMVGLMTGLIIRDLSGNSPNSWTWLSIFAVIALGIILGVYYARKALHEQHPGRNDPTPPQRKGSLSPEKAAHRMNGVLYIVLTAFMSIFIVTSSISSMNNLLSYPSISADLLTENQGHDTYINVFGNSLKSDSPYRVLIKPDEIILRESHTNEDGYILDSQQLTMPGTLDPGEHELIVEASTQVHTTVSLSMPFTVDEHGQILNADMLYAENDQDGYVMAPLNAEWWMGEFMPMFIILLEILVLSFLFLTVRNSGRYLLKSHVSMSQMSR